jgi:hypothetical protein
MTGCPNDRDKASATGRPTVSATPPGGNGITIVMGLLGQFSCANTGVLKLESTATNEMKNKCLKDNFINIPNPFYGCNQHPTTIRITRKDWYIYAK